MFKTHKKGITISFIILFILSILFYGFLVEPKGQSLAYNTIKIDQLPNAWENTKIAFFSDTNMGNAYTLESLKTTIKKINSTQPDLIIFTGILLDNDPEKKINENDIIEQLATLKAPLGKYAILTEYNDTTEIEQVQRILGTADFQMLANDCRYIYRKDLDALNLIALNKNATTDQKQQLLESSLETTTLLFTDDVELFDTVAQDYPNIQLMFSYSTYGGNIGIPFINRLLAHTQYPKGIYKKNEQTLIVSSGVGTPHNFYFRLFNRPKIYIITIQQKI